MSSSQNAVPKARTVLGLGVSSVALYALYYSIKKKKRIQGQIQNVKDGFGRVKDDHVQRLKQAKEEFKCMPAVQEARKRAIEQKFN